MPSNFDKLQFMPGDQVSAWVGGHQVINGFISERHVAFDATSHAVRLVGTSRTIDLSKSTVPRDKLGNHDGKSWTAFVSDIISHLGIGVKHRGAVDDTPFENIQVQPGELLIQVIERYARMRNIIIGNDPFGDLLAIGPHAVVPTSHIHEGYNLLAANSVLRDLNTAKYYEAAGQSTGSDQANGAGQNQQFCGPLSGTNRRNKHMLVAADIADTQHGICQRAKIEQMFGEGSKLEAHLTMQGYFEDLNKSDEIWRGGAYYTVTSPMLVFDGVVLGCRSCIYEQSERGSTTTLELVDPSHMNGQRRYQPRAGA